MREIRIGNLIQDYKEGINKGLEIAKDAFEENAEKFVYSNSNNSNEDRDVKTKSL